MTCRWPCRGRGGGVTTCGEAWPRRAGERAARRRRVICGHGAGRSGAGCDPRGGGYPLVVSFAGLDAWLRSRAAGDLFSGVVLIRRGEADGVLGSVRLGYPPVGGAGLFGYPVRYRVDHEAVHVRWRRCSWSDEGRLGLDMPIVDVVDLAGTTISPAVTLRHLLTHTSGIADDADEEAEPPRRVRRATGLSGRPR